MGKSNYIFDAFVSHAVEDKIPVANNLSEKLRTKGLHIWYSGDRLHIGKSLQESIKEGLMNSRFCIVVFSPDFLNSEWTMKELNAALFREEKNFILPVLYNITLEEVAQRVPAVADIWSIHFDRGLDVVVEKIYERITADKVIVDSPKRAHWMVGSAMTSLVVLVVVLMNIGPPPMTEQIAEGVESRMLQLQSKIDTRLSQFNHLNARSVELTYIDSIFNRYSTLPSYYRNEYSLDNGFRLITARKNVEAHLNIPVRSIGPFNYYGMNASSIYVHHAENPDGKDQVSYALANDTPLSYEATGLVEIAPNKYSVTIDYDNNIRFVEVILTFARHSKDTKTHRMNIIGVKPRETYFLEETDGRWTLTEVNSNTSETN